MRNIFTYFFICILTITFCIHNNYAQNLVPNGGFEEQDSCPIVSEIFLAPPWESATLGTPDLFNSTCPTQNIGAHEGVGSSGVYLLNTFTDNREYEKAPLDEPLEAGIVYNVSFWVKRVNYRYAVNRIGVYLTSENIDETTTGVLEYVPQVENPEGNMLSSTSWEEISGSFVADGGEAYIVLGNFHPDSETDTLVANAASSSNVAFYQIDDVSVIAGGVAIEEKDISDKIHLFPIPADDYIMITLHVTDDVDHINIYNQVGQLTETIPVENKIGPEFTIDLTLYSTGIYTVVAKGGLVSGIKKFVVN